MGSHRCVVDSLWRVCLRTPRAQGHDRSSLHWLEVHGGDVEGCLMTPMRVLQQEGNVTDLRVEVGSFNRRAWLAVELMCWAEARGEREDTAGLRSFLADYGVCSLPDCKYASECSAHHKGGADLQLLGRF